MPLTTRKGGSSPFVRCCSGLSALTILLIARAWFASRTRALIGIALRGSNRSNDSEKKENMFRILVQLPHLESDQHLLSKKIERVAVRCQDQL